MIMIYVTKANLCISRLWLWLICCVQTECLLIIKNSDLILRIHYKSSTHAYANIRSNEQAVSAAKGYTQQAGRWYFGLLYLIGSKWCLLKTSSNLQWQLYRRAKFVRWIATIFFAGHFSHDIHTLHKPSACSFWSNNIAGCPVVLVAISMVMRKVRSKCFDLFVTTAFTHGIAEQITEPFCFLGNLEVLISLIIEARKFSSQYQKVQEIQWWFCDIPFSHQGKCIHPLSSV